MDKCIIRCSDKPVGNTLVRVYPATYRKLDALASKANRSITSVASELLDFALERAEVEYTYWEGMEQQDNLFEAASATEGE